VTSPTATSPATSPTNCQHISPNGELRINLAPNKSQHEQRLLEAQRSVAASSGSHSEGQRTGLGWLAKPWRYASTLLYSSDSNGEPGIGAGSG
jgi:hypothetical protein